MPPENGGRAELLVQRAEVLPRLRKRSESVPRALVAFGTTVGFSVWFALAVQAFSEWREHYAVAAGSVCAVVAVAFAPWPLRSWCDGRRCRQLYLAWLVAPDRWPSGPAEVPLETKTVADAVTLDELATILHRDAVALQTATAQNGPLLRLIFGSAAFAIGLLGIATAIFAPNGLGAAGLGGPLVVMGAVSVGGIFRLGGVTSIARHRVMVAAKKREAELKAALETAEQE